MPFSNFIVHRYSREEIRAKIKKGIWKNDIKNIDFEFAISTTSMIEINSCLYPHLSFVYPIQIPNGSFAEGPGPQELLVLWCLECGAIIWCCDVLDGCSAVIFTCIIFVALNNKFRPKKKLSDKIWLINNMTHEFKTLLATISNFAADALKMKKSN